MHLINVNTFTLKDFSSSSTRPAYAILSHTWGDEDTEVSFQDLKDLDRAREKAGFEKIEWTCLQAKADGIEWAWVDTCCIDKSSSHEMTQAINSMFRWYIEAAVCYVYLIDVPGNCPPFDDDCTHPSHLRFVEAFEESRWFTRGWTLQELIAPRCIIFFGQAWNPIASLSDVVNRVSGITGIQVDVLTHSCALSDLSIARRLSWAAKRKTTRVEDEAYSLLGLLNVNMPLMYGEGPGAFIRLQEAIIAKFTDQSIFAWDRPAGFANTRELLLAPSPSCFANAGTIRRRRGIASEMAFSIRNNGLEITLPVLRRRLDADPASPQNLLGILDCKYEGSTDVLALALSQHPFSVQGGTGATEVYVSGFDKVREGTKQYARLVSVKRADIQEAKPRLLTITKDLRSRTYMQDFSMNDPTWFPVRFTGDERSSSLTLKDVYPEDCWSEGSRTLRLNSTHHSYGGIVVGTLSGSVLITFGIEESERNGLTRRIYDMVLIDPFCPIKPHLEALIRGSKTSGSMILRLPLKDGQRIVAQVYMGAALTISIESADYTASTPSSPSLARLSPSLSRRQDSFLTDSRSERSDGSPGEISPTVHHESGCWNCHNRMKKELERRARRQEEKRKQAAAAAAQKAQEEKQQTRAKQFKRARNVSAAGLSLGTLLADLGDIDFL